jgi:hypothetical protein
MGREVRQLLGLHPRLTLDLQNMVLWKTRIFFGSPNSPQNDNKQEKGLGNPTLQEQHLVIGGELAQLCRKAPTIAKLLFSVRAFFANAILKFV